MLEKGGITREGIAILVVFKIKGTGHLALYKYCDTETNMGTIQYLFSIEIHLYSTVVRQKRIVST